MKFLEGMYLSLINTFVSLINTFVGFYTAAEFEKYMRYLESPRKRQYDSMDDNQAQASPRGQTSNPVLLKRRKAKQAVEDGVSTA